MSNDRDEAIRMARECGLIFQNSDIGGGIMICPSPIMLEAFYLSAKAKGAEEENEACANVAARYGTEPWKHSPEAVHVVDMVASSIAKKIRARKGKKCST